MSSGIVICVLSIFLSEVVNRFLEKIEYKPDEKKDEINKISITK
ncbi:MAG: hypothetical protein WCT49_01195 [Candidatus Paceibacterota bacterium]|jgi:hypothetical protein